MAEFVFREMAEKRGMGALFHAASAATSGEELGNPVHQGTREKLQAVGISCADKRAVRLRPDDYRRRPGTQNVPSAGLLRSPP